MSSTAEVLVAPVPDPGVRTVLLPKWRTALARAREERSGTPVKLLLLALVAAGFWSAVFTVAYRVLLYARSAPEIGSFLPQKMLGVILLAFASILLLSNLVTALSTFFLAKDLDMLIAAPIDWLRLYLAKLGETVAHSSWMVALLAIPIFTAYGIVYDGGPWFWLVALGAFVPFLLLPGVIGAVITLVLVNVFPARRTRDLLSLVAIGAMAIVVVTLRVLQPERLARPEGFRNLVDFLGALQSPTSPFLPTEWTADIIMNWLNRVADPLPIVLLWSTAGVVRGSRRAGAQAPLPERLHQGAGRRRAVRARQALAALRVPAAARPAGGQARVHREGRAAVLPRYDAVEPAHPARGAPAGLHLQHPRAAALHR